MNADIFFIADIGVSNCDHF